MLNLVYLTDDKLFTPTREVEVFDDSIKNLAQEMLSSLDKFNGVGLASVQVGSDYKMFVTDTKKKGEQLVFINPVILETSQDSVGYEEGCLSLPGVYRTIYRPSCVTIRAQDVNGKKFIINAKGLLARVIQHEYDHLVGKVFIDRLDEKEKNSAKAQAVKNISKIKK